jgi:hypothetical protein
MDYADGSRYEGEWVDTLRHGTGQFVDARRGNAVYTGEWVRGGRRGAGEANYATASGGQQTLVGKWTPSGMTVGTVVLRADNSRGPGVPMEPLRTPLRTPGSQDPVHV